MKRHFQRRGTQTVEYVRVPEDVDRYRMKPNRIEVTNALIEGVKAGFSLSFFPEGTVEAGRTKVREKRQENNEAQIFVDIEEFLEGIGLIGEINGMQPFDGEVFGQAKRIADKYSKGALFVPIAINGVHHILKPTTDRKAILTPYSFAALLSPFDLGLITVRVGVPIMANSMVGDLSSSGKEVNGQNMADYIGFQIARLLPENARGVYAQAA